MSPNEEGSAAVFHTAAGTLLRHLRLFEVRHPGSVNDREVSALYDLYRRVPKGIRELDNSTIPDLIKYVAYRVRDISQSPFGRDAAPYNENPESAYNALFQLRNAVDTLEWMCTKQRHRLAALPKDVTYLVPWHKKVIRAVLEWAWRFGE